MLVSHLLKNLIDNINLSLPQWLRTPPDLFGLSDLLMEMADGIEVEDLPQFTTRSELMKKVNRISKCIWKAIELMAPACMVMY